MIIKQDNREEIIVVNAHTITSFGALGILRQFLCAIQEFSSKNQHFIIFVSEGVTLDNLPKNVTIREVGYKFVGAKVYFCYWGMQKILKREGIVPKAVVSLSNIGTKLKGGVPDFLYFHQTITVYPNRWNPFRKSERVMFYYQNVFRPFVKWSITKRTTVVVQLDAVAERFSRRFGVARDRILKVVPRVKKSEVSGEMVDMRGVEIDGGSINLFYPATSYKYKNHKVLLDALSGIKHKRVTLYLTLKPEDIAYLGDYELLSNVEIVYLGAIPVEMVEEMYRRVDALVFPSYVESFGLPLVEGAMQGVRILASDMDFSREVLGDYGGVSYLRYDSVEEWRDGICGVVKGEKFSAMKERISGSWELLFDILVD